MSVAGVLKVRMNLKGSEGLMQLIDCPSGTERIMSSLPRISSLPSRSFKGKSFLSFEDDMSLSYSR